MRIPMLALLCSALIVAAGDAPSSASAPPAASRIERAKQLFSQGPSKAGEVISLLQTELKEHPDSVDAHKLLGMAFFYSARFPEAVTEFDWVVRTQIDAPQATLSISPRLLLYRVEALARSGKTRLAIREFIRLGGFTMKLPEHENTRSLLLGLHELRLVEDARELLLRAGVKLDSSDVLIPLTDRAASASIQDGDLTHAFSIFISSEAEDAVLLLDAKGETRRWLVLFKDNQAIGVTHAEPATQSGTYTATVKPDLLISGDVKYEDWTRGQLTTDDGKPLTAYTHR